MNKKNYLFAPFEDDDEKIEVFKHLKNYLPKGHRNELIMFIGRLESYYDVIISDLKTECWCGCSDELKAEISNMKAEIKEKEKQYHMLASSKASHYPKEYKQEADEYFEHNEKCNKLLFFMIDVNEFEWDEDNDGMNGMNGEFNGILYADDCIAEYDNE